MNYLPHLEQEETTSIPFPDECRRLITKVLSQAALDFINFAADFTQVSEEDFLTASGLIFDNEYSIDWGNENLTFEKICIIVNVEPEWFRDRIKKRIIQRKNTNESTERISRQRQRPIYTTI